MNIPFLIDGCRNGLRSGRIESDFSAYTNPDDAPARISHSDSALLFLLGKFAVARKLNQQDRLHALTDICLSLPETRREDKGSHSAFLVGKKTFAYYLNNHHGDNIISMCCKVLPGENGFLVESGPGRFYLPAYIGSRG
jgi:hypothetical protein